MIKKNFEGLFFKTCFFPYFIRLFTVKFLNKVCYVICGLSFCDYGSVHFGASRGYTTFLIKKLLNAIFHKFMWVSLYDSIGYKVFL